MDVKRDSYSIKDFTELKNRINIELNRRGTFKWWGPLTTPEVGEDRSSPLSLPAIGKRVPVDEKTYTINTDSSGSICPTHNIDYTNNGDNPGGEDWKQFQQSPDTSAAHFRVDEIKNFLVGLATIHDIPLYMGRDEKAGMAYRDPQLIVDILESVESDKLHQLADHDITKKDPKTGKSVTFKVYEGEDNESLFPSVVGHAVMPSGEYTGDELLLGQGLGPHNFFDDYGAPEGDGDYHPFNKATIPTIDRDFIYHDDHRNINREYQTAGGTPSGEYGPNPRNPEKGSELSPRPIFEGVPGTCQTMCTGLCYTTCDDFCSESCSSTCTERCGTACGSGCTSGCQGSCSTQCYTSCKTKCENTTGYACVKAGAKTLKLETSGGRNGEPAKVTMETTTYSCNNTCSYSCQYYPNKKTTCWDAGCTGNCFTSCENGCANSCMGSCMDNDPVEGSDYKTGKGRGCSSSCTVNCIGTCTDTCTEECTSTCYHQCMDQCFDNCTFECSTDCGSGCSDTCTNWCKFGCSHSCENGCRTEAVGTTCVGCAAVGGCAALCQVDCNANCVNNGCRSMCGAGPESACSANCRINCMSTSCTAMCSDQCNNLCTTCVGTCDMKCGACTSNCAADCTQVCAIYCTDECMNSCSTNCVNSCSEECGGCSGLCFSCVGMCIGVCMLHCENGCSGCAGLCTGWCDQECNQACMANCDDLCLATCVGSCISYANAEVIIPEDSDALVKDKLGWENPNSSIRIHKIEENLYQSVYGDNEPANLEIVEGGDLELDSTGSESDVDAENYSFEIEGPDLLMRFEAPTRGDDFDKYLLIPEWSKEDGKDK